MVTTGHTGLQVNSMYFLMVFSFQKKDKAFQYLYHDVKMSFLLASGGHKTVIKMVILGHRRLQIKMRWSSSSTAFIKRSPTCHTYKLFLK